MRTTRSRFIPVAAFAVLQLFFIAPAMAQIRADSFYLTPSVGGYLFDSDQGLEDAPAYGLGVGKYLAERWSTELSLHYIDTEVESTGESVDGYLYRLEGLYHLLPKRKLVPFLAAGFGGVTIDPDDGGWDSDFILEYGAGLKYFTSESLALRADLRHVIAMEEPDHNLFFTVGLDFIFGGAQPPAAPVDSDGDGVIDAMDRCPETPRGVFVDSSGCPLDRDGDGVNDARDKCPDTDKGVMVDEDGCSISLTLHIEFDLDKAEIKPEHAEHLAKAAEFIRRYPAPQVLIVGHTDNQGDADYNKDLSLRRAQNVRQYLIDHHGIAPDNLVAKGMGEERPIADNGTAEGRQRNRRVEITCCAVILE